MSLAAAQKFVDLACRAVKAKGRFAVAFSGGDTPRRAYELLARPEFKAHVPWEGVHVFWGDERCVPVDDPRSNERMARKALLDHVPIPPAQIHPIACAESPYKEAERYESLLRDFFTGWPSAFDLVLLGLGEDGHTAALFPRSSGVKEMKRWATEVEDYEAGICRVTLTAPLFNQAAVVAFLVSGRAKARALYEVLEGPLDPTQLPAKLIRPPKGELLWLVDEAAGAELKET